MRDHTTQVLTLRDGRTLGYAEWGDLRGKPVFFFGGSGNARLMRHPDDSIITDLGIHLYTFDRPGLGLSSRQPKRRLLDWAEDIRDFVQQRQISHVAIVAASQGGPYGAACAYALSKSLACLTLVSGVAGLEDDDVMSTQNRMIKAQIFMARHTPALLTLQYNLMRPMLKGKRGERLVRSILSSLPESDQHTLSMPGAIDLMVEDLREGIRQGGMGATDDMRAVVLDWGFELEDITTEVFVWQGEDDPNVTPAMARYMTARISNSKATFVPGAGHFLIYSHWHDILQQVLDHWGQS